MQPRDGGGKAQTETRAGFRPALLQTHEALHNPPAIGFRNARTAVGHAQRYAIAVKASGDYDLGWCAVKLALRPGIFDRVVDQIGERLADQLAIADRKSVV